jgi:hypothetical protein
VKSFLADGLQLFANVIPGGLVVAAVILIVGLPEIPPGIGQEFSASAQLAAFLVAAYLAGRVVGGPSFRLVEWLFHKIHGDILYRKRRMEFLWNELTFGEDDRAQVYYSERFGLSASTNQDDLNKLMGFCKLSLAHMSPAFWQLLREEEGKLIVVLRTWLPVIAISVAAIVSPLLDAGSGFKIAVAVFASLWTRYAFEVYDRRRNEARSILWYYYIAAAGSGAYSLAPVTAEADFSSRRSPDQSGALVVTGNP